jgi:hypothetical protein
MEYIVWKSDSRPVGKVIPNLLRVSKVHYNLHKSPLLDPILGQLNPVYLHPHTLFL